MLHRNRGGFTLVELLVVVVVIGILVSILVPAVNSAREAARQTRCMNNIKEFGTAIFSYTTATDHYPGFTNPGGHGWVVVILEELGNKSLWETCRSGTPPLYGSQPAGTAPNVKLAQAVCPNDDAYDEDTNPNALSYVANINICVDRSAGGPGVLATDIKNTTKTVLIGEMVTTTNNNNWHDNGSLTTFLWDTNQKVKDSLSSDHPNIVVVGFCDGHAEKLNKQMDIEDESSGEPKYFGTPDGTPTPPPPP